MDTSPTIRPHARRSLGLCMAGVLLAYGAGAAYEVKPLEPPRAQVEQAIDLVEGLLHDHEGMLEEFPPRVYFADIDAQAFTIRVIYWYAPPNYWDYMAFGQNLNLAIFRAFEEHGIAFSLPSRLTPTNMEGTEPFDNWTASPEAREEMSRDT